MNTTADDVNVELYAAQKVEKCVRNGFEDNAGSHDFKILQFEFVTVSARIN